MFAVKVLTRLRERIGRRRPMSFQSGSNPERLPYRLELFKELQQRYPTAPRSSILEIGPKDGADSIRLSGLNPSRFVMIDLPEKEPTSRSWLDQVSGEYVSANFMYWQGWHDLLPFDLIWCTGVLYHNPEQLRMLRMLYRKLNIGGVLALESATARRPENIQQAVVEIYWPNGYRNSVSTTHLPSKAAVEMWLNMVGFGEVSRSRCFEKYNADIERYRGAWLCRKTEDDAAATYYDVGNGVFRYGDSI